MKQLRQHLRQPRTWLAIVLAIGVFFRLYHLDYKVYWYDETQTSLRISGHTRQEMVEAVYNGEPIRVRTLIRNFQYPNDDRDLEDTLAALSGSPEHAPLYFLMARSWLQVFGHSIATIRSLSAIFGILALPAMYWLAWELFQSQRVSWAATLLLAVSPFHVLYAQEARQYSLWTVTILVSSALLLRALRQNTRLNWIGYALSVAVGLYTHTFTALILVGHGIYVGFIQRFALKRMAAYLGATIGGIVLFGPWLWVIIDNFAKFTRNTASVTVDRADLQLIWGLNLSRLFFDLNQGPNWFNPVSYLLLALVIYAFYSLIRQTPIRIWLFVVTLAGVTGLALLGPDVLLGGRRSSITRYAIPSFLAIELAVAYLLAWKTQPTQSSPEWRDLGGYEDSSSTPDSKSLKRSHWKGIGIALLLSGILSCAVNSQYQVWWHKSHSKSFHNPAVAKIVNRANRPIVLSDQNPGMILSLAHLLDDDVRLQLVEKPEVPEMSDRDNTLFLYRPSTDLQTAVEKRGWRLEEAYKVWLWKLKRK
jgi:uncharacterized membrane protein